MPSVSMESLPDAAVDHDNQALTRSSCWATQANQWCPSVTTYSPLVAAQQALDLAYHRRLLRLDGRVGGILGDQPHVSGGAIESLYRGLVLDQGHHYRPVVSILLRLHYHEVAVQDAGVHHRVTAYPQGEPAVLCDFR